MYHLSLSEIVPCTELRLWEYQDIPGIARMAEKMKQRGALAGIQPAYSEINRPNLDNKELPLVPMARASYAWHRFAQEVDMPEHGADSTLHRKITALNHEHQ